MAAGCQFANATEPVISYINKTENFTGYVLDTRPAALCEKASLAGARCLPSNDLFGPHKRLANFSGVLWLFGTAGLEGNEHVLVVGDHSNVKEAVAGLLYLSGQKKVSVLKQSISALPKTVLTPGTSRSKTREKIYQAAMRADRIVLRSDLKEMLNSDKPPLLFDGRKEGEYWGQHIRALRGGHIPGAQHQPIIAVGSSSALTSTSPVLAYAHNAFEGLVYLARLNASGISADLYLEGWVGWASDGALAADNVTYPEPVTASISKASPLASAAAKKSSWEISWPQFASLGLAGLALSVGGFFVGRSSQKAEG